MKKYKIGDKVKIRGWYDMVNEFGLDRDGCIQTKNGFVEDMRDFCGKVGTITSELLGGTYDVEFDGKISCWSFDPEMFEDVSEDIEDSTKSKPIKEGDHHEITVTIKIPKELTNYIDCVDFSIRAKE